MTQFDSESSTPPRLLGGRYELTHRLARGGMAEVFLANDQVLNRQVAVKMLFARHADDATFVTRFQREAQSSARLNHPNVVAVYDSGIQDGTHFMVMEYVQGQSLAELLKAEGSVPIGEAARIASEVAAALEVAHQQGIIHRDIKPGNILLTKQGQAKVTDFGISRAIGGDIDLTQAGQVMGTAAYLSPEQAQGLTLDPRSDLYSVGVVLFKMITGETPFTGTSDLSIAYKHVQEPAPSASSRVGAIPQALDSIVDALLAKDPDSRYASAADLEADLELFRANRPVRGVEPPPGVPAAGADVLTQQAFPSQSGFSEQGAQPQPGYATQHIAQQPGLPPQPGLSPQHGGQQQGFDQQGFNQHGGQQPGMGFPADNGGATTAMVAPGPLATHQDEYSYAQPVSQPQPGPSSASGWFMAVMVLLAIIVVGLVILIAATLLNTGNEAAGAPVAMPDVIGAVQATAVEQLVEVGLVPEVLFEANPDVPGDTVFAQEPVAETEQRVGDMVTILVALSGNTVDVPDVTGRTLVEAQAELRALGFAVTVENQPSEDVEAGRVAAQSIASGQAASSGSAITIFVSSGANRQPVPTVTNLLQAEAQQLLIDQGFVPQVEFTDVAPDSDKIGVVVSQSPEPNQNAFAGSPVVIRIGQPAVADTTTSSTPSTTPPTTTTSLITTTTQPTTASTADTTTTTTKPTTTTEDTTSSSSSSTTEDTTSSSTTTTEPDPPTTEATP